MASNAIFEDLKQTLHLQKKPILDCLDEIHAAEENFAIVLETARKADTFLSKIRSIDITPVISLVQDPETTDLIIDSEGIKRARQRRLDPAHRPVLPQVVNTIPGCNGSFSNLGDYRVVCLVDFFRFNISRPRPAEEKEVQPMIAKRMAFTHGSCAEWELYNTAPARQPVQRTTANGAQKQTNWDFEHCGMQPVPICRQPHPNVVQDQPLSSSDWVGQRSEEDSCDEGQNNTLSCQEERGHCEPTRDIARLERVPQSQHDAREEQGGRQSDKRGIVWSLDDVDAVPDSVDFVVLVT